MGLFYSSQNQKRMVEMSDVENIFPIFYLPNYWNSMLSLLTGCLECQSSKIKKFVNNFRCVKNQPTLQLIFFLIISVRVFSCKGNNSTASLTNQRSERNVNFCSINNFIRNCYIRVKFLMPIKYYLISI